MSEARYFEIEKKIVKYKLQEVSSLNTLESELLTLNYVKNSVVGLVR